ncbi:MAG: hypothetical protein RSC68_31210, partial [Acinetobacter sp.]
GADNPNGELPSYITGADTPGQIIDLGCVTLMCSWVTSYFLILPGEASNTKSLQKPALSR